MRVRVTGVGTPHGEDTLGLEVLTRVARARLPAEVSLLLCERPLPDLVDALEGVEALVLVDALRSGARPGSVHRLSPQDLPTPGPLSTHGVGVAGALELSAALGYRPRRVEIIGIEAGAMHPDGRGTEVERGIEEAAELVTALARRLAAEPGGSGAGPRISPRR